jgi:hypothetical protein
MPFFRATRVSSSKNFLGGTTYPPSPCTGSTTMAAVSSAGAMVFSRTSSICFTHSTAQVSSRWPNGQR